MRHPHHIKICLLVFFVGALWGFYWLPQRALESGGLTGGWATIIQYIIPLILLLPQTIWKLLKKQSTGFEFPLIGLFMGGGLACYANSLLLTDIMRALILFFLMPIWTTLLQIVIFKQKPQLQRIVSLILALSGLLIVFNQNGKFPFPHNAGDWLALFSGMLCAAGAIKLQSIRSESISSLLFSFFFYGTLVTLFLAILMQSSFGPIPDFNSLIEMLPLILLISIGFLIPSNIVVLWSPSKIGASLFSILILSEIVFGTLSSGLFADEPFGLREIIGGTLMLLAGFLEVMSGPKKINYH